MGAVGCSNVKGQETLVETNLDQLGLTGLT